MIIIDARTDWPLDQESTMEKTQETARETWTRPELVRLGRIGDVGPGNPGAGEGGSGKS